MCSLEKSEGKKRVGKLFWEGLLVMGVRGESRIEKLRNSVAASSRSSRMKLWMIRATTSVLLWTCIVQLTALGDVWGPRVLKGWPSCFTHESALIELPSAPPRVLPPKSQLHNFCYYLRVSYKSFCYLESVTEYCCSESVREFCYFCLS